LSDQEIELERVYTVPLSRAWITARHRRTRRAVNILKEFAEHHMKSSEIKIDTELNEELWKRGITKPPRRITVKMEKDEDGVVTISLPKKAKKDSEMSILEETVQPQLVSEQKTAEPVAQESKPVAVKEAPKEQPQKRAKKTAAKKKAKKSES